MKCIFPRQKHISIIVLVHNKWDIMHYTAFSGRTDWLHMVLKMFYQNCGFKGKILWQEVTTCIELWYWNCCNICMQMKQVKKRCFVLKKRKTLPCALKCAHYRFFVNKTNRCTEFQLYSYYCSTCFGQPFCPSSAQQFHPTPGSKRFITTA